MTAHLPEAIRAMAGRGSDWADWVAELPGLRDAVLEEWSLVAAGPATHGFCSLVIPVRRARGGPAMLKIGFPDDESEHESLALQHWHGRGAVRLYRADPRRRVLLLERLRSDNLGQMWDVEAAEVVGGLYRLLHTPAPPRMRPLTAYVERWTEDLARLPRSAPLPPSLVAQALSLGREFVRDSASTGTLIHTDLHYANVLATSRDNDQQPWLAIDPKPVSGDPHYEVAPMLWNRTDELAGRLRDGLRQRFRTLVDVAGLDEHRARDWVIVRMLHNALCRLQDPVGTRRVTPTDTYLTLCVTIAKSVQD